mmetsp:Transcript_19450/g.37265  ORF Transcript_19450/g.37265 Transcript_19450/m.37265 type:complete len:153 (-) Transcript_19450:327-785(-)|eukprot:CAMPEP_0114256636 /NCGR_PEP_ID=MMETSP0058-20121206/18276_1 /TAXON_ID=36894 /ORGANISM="Pyramimonas parkeae, CCMP726" /LENGTH=152 /DNA_ID=CAMNT_0001371251 /DNA_START=276 /DNA_END=734 /DNA_ORIENTATION=-
MEGLSLGTISTALQDVSSSVQQRQHLKQFAVLVQLSSDTNASLERLFQILDCHRSGYITESAFISPFAKQAQLRTQLASTWEKFQALFDVDQDGRISREDFELGLKSHALHRPGTALNAAPLGEQLLQLQSILNASVMQLIREVEAAFLQAS